ncbi:hypothetical protein, partial [Kitasatospora sp. NPDC057198]|uniref:hypothetical protein n=1 Tax=Kitasatospora sp. NPDC057198 TaxID=3346046 RepID=UPI00363EB456
LVALLAGPPRPRTHDLSPADRARLRARLRERRATGAPGTATPGATTPVTATPAAATPTPTAPAPEPSAAATSAPEEAR